MDVFKSYLIKIYFKGETMSFLVGFCLGILSADFLLNDGKSQK